jgi:CRP-like cAMP-binding protein
LRWIWYAARRERLHLNGARDDFSTTERVEEALRAVVAPALRLDATDQEALGKHTRLVRYGADEIVEAAGRVPAKMTFLVAGRVRLMAVTDDGSNRPVGTLEEGAFLGLTALTRQPNFADAYAVNEVTVLEIDRDHLVELVMRKPLLLRDFGRAIDERRAKAAQAAEVQKPVARERTS